MVGYRMGWVVVLSGALAVLGTAAAFVLTRLIGLFLHLFWFGRLGWHLVEPHGSPVAGRWWTALLPVAGAAAVGLMIRYGSRAIAGHGIPEAMEAVWLRVSRVLPRVAVLKPLSAAISIGSGGPFGAEGPIIMTGGALGSLLGQILPTSPEERKVLLAAGAAAGMVAIFGTPIAAVLLVCDLLLGAFAPRTVVPVAVAAGAAAALRGLVMGEGGPLFPGVPVVPLTVAQVPWYGLVGATAGAAAGGITWLLYALEDAYERLPGLGSATRPLVGGLLVGLVGLAFPRALGVGYDTIGELLAGHLGLAGALAVLVWKLLAWSVSLSSGTSGGVLAPVLMIGGALGAVLGHVAQPWSGLPVGLVALVAMAALFGASIRSALTAALFAAEVTGRMDALAPLLLTCAVADYVAMRLVPYSIMTGKLVRRGHRLGPPGEAAPALEGALAHGDD